MIVQEVSGQCEVLRHNDAYIMKNSVGSVIHLGHPQIQIQAPLRSKWHLHTSVCKHAHTYTHREAFLMLLPGVALNDIARGKDGDLLCLRFILFPPPHHCFPGIFAIVNAIISVGNI